MDHIQFNRISQIMELKRLYFLVYLKKKKRYYLRNEKGENLNFIGSLNLKRINFCGRTKNTLFLKSQDTLFYIDINKEETKGKIRYIKKETVNDVLFCIWQKMLIQFDGQELNYYIENEKIWKSIILNEPMNDVELLYSYKKTLFIYGTNINEESRVLQINLEEKISNPAKKIKISSITENEKSQNYKESNDDDEEGIQLQIKNKQCFQLKQNVKIIKIQCFKESDRVYLYYIILKEKKKQKIYQVLRMPSNIEICLSKQADSLSGFFVRGKNLFLYGHNKRGRLLVYKYNFKNQFKLIQEENRHYFKEDETKNLFPLMLTPKEVNILTEDNFKILKIKEISLINNNDDNDEKKSLIISRKRNADKPRPNYYEKEETDSSLSEDSYNSEDDIEYLKSSSSSSDQESINESESESDQESINSKSESE